MEIEIDTTISAAKNATLLYEKAKKLEKKAQKARKALEKIRKKIEKLRKGMEVKKEDVIKEKKRREWYEKFRWFISSEGNLVIGGRDAGTNELLVKRYVRPTSVVLHADITGAPFFTILTEKPAEREIEEAAVAAASFSRAWKLGYGSVDVYWVRGEQLSKKAPAGEYLRRGAFMIYGRKNWLGKMELKLAVGRKGEMVTSGPLSAIEKWAEKFVVIRPGHMKPGEAVKEISKLLEANPNEVQRALPSGKFEIEK